MYHVFCTTHTRNAELVLVKVMTNIRLCHLCSMYLVVIKLKIFLLKGKFDDLFKVTTIENKNFCVYKLVSCFRLCTSQN